MAQATREQNMGTQVGLWGSIKISNHCDYSCIFCGLRASNQGLLRYRLSTERILDCALQAVAHKCGAILLQAGHDPELDAQTICEIIRRIKSATGLKVALSLGERSEAELAAWRREGAEAYFLRFLTGNATLYHLLHGQPCQDPRLRIQQLAHLKQLGYKVGSGIMVGIPGQSYISLAKDLELLQRLKLETIIIGPYIWPGGPRPWSRPVAVEMCGQVPGSAIEVFKAIALARQLCPAANIPCLAALASLGEGNIHQLALQRGANILLPEFTPRENRAQYRSYDDRAVLDSAGLALQLEEVARAQKLDAANKEGLAGEQANGGARLRVAICMGSSCFSRGNRLAVGALKDFIQRNKLSDRVELEGHLCEGQCKEGPNVKIGAEPCRRLQPEEVITRLRREFKLKE
jgi:biotin synthase